MSIQGINSMVSVDLSLHKVSSTGGGDSVSTAPQSSQSSQSTTAQQQQSSTTSSADQVSQAVKEINKTLQSLSVGVEFSMDSDTHQQVIKVVDTQTKDVIRQIPSEDVLEIAKALDKIQGLLIREEA